MKITDEMVEALAVGFIASEGIPDDYERSIEWARHMHDTYKEAEHEHDGHDGTCMRCLVDDGYIEAKRTIFAFKSVAPLIARAENAECAEIARAYAVDRREREAPRGLGPSTATPTANAFWCEEIEGLILARHPTPSPKSKASTLHQRSKAEPQ